MLNNFIIEPLDCAAFSTQKCAEMEKVLSEKYANFCSLSLGTSDCHSLNLSAMHKCMDKMSQWNSN